MRFSRWALGFLTLGLAAALPAPADIIVLKSGRRITASTVREEGARISYETEDGQYSLPRSLVERIEKGGLVAAPAAQPRPATAMPFPPAPAARSAEKAPVLSNGELDREQLEALARRPVPDDAARRRLSDVFVAAVDYEISRGRTDAALALVQRGVSALPEDPPLMVQYGALLIVKQQHQAARDWLRRASLAAPDSPDAWKYLGFAEYFSDRTDDAIRSWRKSLSLAPDPDVRRMLDRAQRETSAEARYEQAFSNHFNLRFEGREVTPAFRREILEVLERHYQELDRQLDAAVREPIAVILYTNQAFRDVTRAPAWTGAVNDGRVRVPVEGLDGVTPELSLVLKHELVHSFVRAKTRGSCPTWLNEGLAQALEGSSVKGERRLAEFWEAGRRLPWPALNEPFIHLDARLVPFAYAQSLAAVEFLISRHGLHELARLLSALAQGQPIEAALKSVYRLGYPELDQGIGEFLRGAR